MQKKVNLWFKDKESLFNAYLKQAKAIRFANVTYGIKKHITKNKRLRIIDIGGGYGMQAILLAKLGHFITILDPDSDMIIYAKKLVGEENKQIRSRIEIIEGYGENASKLVDNNFDLACCHSVFPYINNPQQLIRSIALIVNKEGLVSILSLNKEAIAMRSGLQGKWQDAIQTIIHEREISTNLLASNEFSREFLLELFHQENCNLIRWYGVGIFTDHILKTIPKNQFSDICTLEWLAGTKDPYRRVARLFHAILRKSK